MSRIRSCAGSLGCEVGEEVTDAETSKVVYLKRRFRCAWLSEVPG
jgi:hypothetical protein